jgi:hypothetical protein
MALTASRRFFRLLSSLLEYQTENATRLISKKINSPTMTPIIGTDTAEDWELPANGTTEGAVELNPPLG